MKPNLFFLGLIIIWSCQVNESDDHSSSMENFVDSLMMEMTVEEKIGQLNLITRGGGIPTGSVVNTNVESKIKQGSVGGIFGVYGPEMVRKTQQLAVDGSRLGIPMLIGSDVIHGYKTTYPLPIGVSCSWDMNLIEQLARMAAVEATADGIFWNFSPMVDICRDPRWGRMAEASGEDPFLGSEVARAMVRGYQGDDLTLANTMMSTVKHFALYGGSEAGRDYNHVDMSRIRMYNDYLPPYKAAVEEGVGSVMTSFNDVDGIPASGNRWLLTELLRDSWGFEGFTVSDYTSVNEMIKHGLGDLQDVSALALKAGLDMDMIGEGFLTTLNKSLEEGKISEQDINTACRRILEAKYKLGLFDDPYRYINPSGPEDFILTKENRALARKAATRSFVLLKNENKSLPLKMDGTIALIGPLADSRNNMLGTWAPTGKIDYAITILEGMNNIAGDKVNIRYAKGANISNDTTFAKKVNVFGTRIAIDKRTPDEMLNEAISLARNSDAVVAVLGEATEMSGESANRTNIMLPESQKKLLRALVKTGKPIIVVMMSGRPLALVEENELASALLHVWHPGVEAGNAVADVLFGNEVPSGKLTATFPYSVGQIPIYYGQRNTGRPNPGDVFEKFKSNYLDAPNSPLFPFGYGLSYTTFEYSNLSLNKEAMSRDEQIEITVDINNTGDYDGEEVVQLYIRDVVASMTRPLRELKDFKKVQIDKGKTKTISFVLTEEDLGFYDGEMSFRVEPGDFKVFVGGSSSDTLNIDFKLIQ